MSLNLVLVERSAGTTIQEIKKKIALVAGVCLERKKNKSIRFIQGKLQESLGCSYRDNFVLPLELSNRDIWITFLNGFTHLVELAILAKQMQCSTSGILTKHV